MLNWYQSPNPSLFLYHSILCSFYFILDLKEKIDKKLRGRKEKLDKKESKKNRKKKEERERENKEAATEEKK